MSHPLVRATCPSCGDVVLTTDAVGLQEHPGGSRFVFVCPHCRQRVRHDVPDGIIHILRAAGVHQVGPEPELISDHDLAEFLADFDRVDWFDELRRLSRGA